MTSWVERGFPLSKAPLNPRAPAPSALGRRALLGGLLAAGMLAQPSWARDRRQEADVLLEEFRRQTGISDTASIVMRGEEVMHVAYAGAYGADTRIPIASSSKWMFGALILSLVDDGLLALEAPIGTYLPELPAAYAGLRIDALMSYTAGLPGLAAMTELRQSGRISLLESAVQAAAAPPPHPPGARFDYGGPNFQFVGAAAERVTGRSWHELFRVRIATPLAMRATGWGRLRSPPDPGAPMGNPVLQAGVWTTLPDYAAFLTMIAQEGRYRGRSVLSGAAMTAFSQIMTKGLPKGGLDGAGMASAEYMLAHWCERLDGDRCGLESSPGYFGAYPWIDRVGGLHGVLLVQDQRRRIATQEIALRQSLISLFS